MGAWRPKHVEGHCRNETCTVLHQVSVLFDLYYDARKHESKKSNCKVKSCQKYKSSSLHLSLTTSWHSVDAQFITSVRSNLCTSVAMYDTQWTRSSYSHAEHSFTSVRCFFNCTILVTGCTLLMVFLLRSHCKVQTPSCESTTVLCPWLPHIYMNSHSLRSVNTNQRILLPLCFVPFLFFF